MGADSYELYIYSAPWCENCKPFIHDLSDMLAQHPPAGISRMKGVIRVVTGVAKTSKPTQQIAEDYVAALGVPFEPLADYWRTGTIKNYYDVTQGPSIPAAVIIPKGGQAKVFNPGTQANEVYGYLASVLK